MPDAKPRSRVVIVDDEEEICRLLAERVKRWHPVTSFLNPESALEGLAPSAARTIFVLDFYMMPWGNGFDLKRKLDSQFSRAQYLLIGGRINDATFPEEVKAAGFNAHLPKPFPLSEFYPSIEAIDRQWSD